MPVEMEECPFCKGRIAMRRIEQVHRWQGNFYILRNVPAEVCTKCGEVFFAPRELEAMDDIVTREREPQEHLSVPVYTL